MTGENRRHTLMFLVNRLILATIMIATYNEKRNARLSVCKKARWLLTRSARVERAAGSSSYASDVGSSDDSDDADKFEHDQC